VKYRWGIDLGGTKIEGVVLADGEEVPGSRLRVPTEQAQGYEHILDRIALVVSSIEAATGLPRPAAVGIGTPGSHDENGLLHNSNTVCLNRKPLQGDLTRKLGMAVHCANDANCFALAEAVLGAGRGADVVFGVILGTGVGGGLVVHGKVLNGRQGIAGEWGHNELDPNGPPCYCGRIGCVETILSGPFLERFYRERSGEDRRLRDIVARSSEGDKAAEETIQRLCAQFAKGISVVINIVDPDVVVVGGGVGNIDALYANFEALALPWVFNSRVATRLVKPQLGDSAGVFGAAMLLP